MDAINSFHKAAAVRSAFDLDVFTTIADLNGRGAAGAAKATAGAIAGKVSASERGIRILCDHLTVDGLLEKQDGAYRLTPDSAVFCDRQSPAFLGGILRFMHSKELRAGFDDLTASVRRGGTGDQGFVEDDNPVWVDFARAMVPMMMMPAQAMAKILGAGKTGSKLKVLDIAAGHGIFGISIAKAIPQAEVVALDWPKVLDVARENAQAADVSARYSTIEGSAFDADLGTGYDLVLVTNFLHHFDPPTNERLLTRFKTALKPGGQIAILEFVPNADRVSPPTSAAFALIMLVHTQKGDAYTFDELAGMLRNVGFTAPARHDLLPSPETLIVATN